MVYKSNLTWLHLEQIIPWQLEDSFYWFLKKLSINRFSFEYNSEFSKNKTLHIWLPSNEWSLEERDNLVDSFYQLALTFSVRLNICQWQEIKDEDWSLSWKKNWTPDLIGKSLLILPAWLEVPEALKDKKIIRLDPGYAFGTGSHPSTRLCLEALENQILKDKLIADIGCGSGILSFTALALGAKYVSAVDTDSLAVKATKQNFCFNNFRVDSLSVSLGSIDLITRDQTNKGFDLILCNILAPTLKSLAPSFHQVLKNNGKGFLSGILVTQVEDLREFLLRLGWKTIRVFEKDKWALLEIGRN